MKRYKVVFEEKQDTGVYAISVVNSPAMQDKWITLKEEELQFSSIDEEKQILLGAVLIPDKDILRRDPETSEPFTIVFDSQTIEKAAHHFIENGNQGKSTTNHETKLEGVSVVETWIVEDSEKDKSNTFGKQYPKGTWVAMMKVHDQKTWEDAKQGKLNGFSIEALFGLEEIKLNKEEMADKTLLEKIWAKLNKEEPKIELGRLKLKDGKTELEFEGEAPEVGKPIFVLSEDKSERFPAPKGQHETESGEVIHVDANGLVSEEVKEMEVKEEVIEAMSIVMEEELAQVRKDFDAKLSEIKKEFEIKLLEEKKKNDELEAKLKEEPAETGIVKTSLSVEEPRTRKERMLNLAAGLINQN